MVSVVPAGRVVSVNVGRLQPLTVGARSQSTGIFKEPLDGPALLAESGVVGDQIGDRVHHGGRDKAVYAYAAEDYAWWSAELGRTLGPGTFGENLTLEGVDVTGARVGERWAVGGCLVEVAQPRIPCATLAARMGEPRFAARFGRAGRPGAYLRVLHPGEVQAGDRAEVVHRPAHDVTVALVAHAYHRDRGMARSLLVAPELPASWRSWVDRAVS